MQRLAYRNFGSEQRMVVNHTVDVGADRAGIRWYDLAEDERELGHQSAEHVRACRRSPPLDGKHRHGQGREHGDRLHDLERDRAQLPDRQVRGPARDRSAERAPAGRGDASRRHGLADPQRGPLGRLLDDRDRPGRRLHLLVHERVHPDDWERGVEDQDRLLQVPELYRRSATTSASATATTSAATTSAATTSAATTAATAAELRRDGGLRGHREPSRLVHAEQQRAARADRLVPGQRHGLPRSRGPTDGLHRSQLQQHRQHRHDQQLAADAGRPDVQRPADVLLDANGRGLDLARPAAGACEHRRLEHERRNHRNERRRLHDASARHQRELPAVWLPGGVDAVHGHDVRCGRNADWALRSPLLRRGRGAAGHQLELHRHRHALCRSERATAASATSATATTATTASATSATTTTASAATATAATSASATTSATSASATTTSAATATTSAATAATSGALPRATRDRPEAERRRRRGSARPTAVSAGCAAFAPGDRCAAGSIAQSPRPGAVRRRGFPVNLLVGRR